MYLRVKSGDYSPSPSACLVNMLRNTILSVFLYFGGVHLHLCCQQRRLGCKWNSEDAKLPEGAGLSQKACRRNKGFARLMTYCYYLYFLIQNLKSPHIMQFFLWNACISVRTPGFLPINHGSSDFSRVEYLNFEYVLQSRRCFVPAATQVILCILHIFCKSVLVRQTALRRSSERISSECGKKTVSCSVNLCCSCKATIQLRPFSARPQSEVKSQKKIFSLGYIISTSESSTAALRQT